MRMRGSAAWTVAISGLALLAAISPAAVGAQERTGWLVGEVTDERGEPLRHVEIVIPTAGRRGWTDARGRFEFRGLSAGRHRVEGSIVGYAPVSRVVEIPEAGGEVRVALALTATPLSLSGIQVTATPSERNPRAVSHATSQLSGKALERETGGTVAQTLKFQPGVAVRSNGPAAAMPVVRGLTGDRILILQDGQRTADLAGSADDHGVTIDPLVAQRVEVVRGPATLLYGNNAVGGVVNVISEDVPTSVPLSTEWMLAGQSETAYPGGAGTMRLRAPLTSSWALSVRAGARRVGDMQIGDDPVLGDRLENTESSSWDAAAGVGYAGPRGQIGGALKAYGFEYGLPTPPDAEPVSLRGRRGELQLRSEFAPDWAAVPSVRLNATAQDYAHDELFADGTLAQAFGLRTQTVDLMARQGAVGPITEGAWGVVGLFKQYTATGPAALTPPADTRAFGVFGFQEVAFGGGRPLLQVGARYDHYGIASRTSAEFGPGVDRIFRAFSGSLGLIVPLPGGLSASGTVARSFRAPTVEELFSAAPHAGTGAVEFGSPELRAERGRSLEAGLRLQTGRWSGQLAVYRNGIRDYVHLVAVGDTVIGGATLPVLVYDQADAVLAGAEGGLEFAARPDLVIGVMGDVIRGELAGGEPLSFMPAPRVGAMMRWDDGTFMLGGDVHHEFQQTRTGPADDRPTDAHTIFRVTAGVRVTRGGTLHSLTIRGENLGNALHRESTSRIKDFAPGPGRNIAVVYRVYR